MSEFVKKGSLGGYKPVKAGHSDKECSHVILTLAEYDGLLAEIQTEKRRASDAATEAANRIRRTEAKAAEEIQEAQTAAQEEISQMQEQLEQERAEKEFQIGLNETMLRIARERANADRKLRPKKQHTGYVVVMSSEKEYKYKVDRRHWDSVVLWETVLQTPYVIDFTEEQTRKQIRELLEADEQGNWLIGSIGINGSYNGNYDDMLEKSKWTEQEKTEMNIMLTRKLRANYKTGYWEVIFSHTKPLDVVPVDMRAR